MSNEVKEKGRVSKMYGNFVQVPYVWYRLCRKYEIPKEIVDLKKKTNTIEINPMEINVLAYLANFESCYPSNKQLADIFQVGISTIEKYLKELRWVGFIKTFEEKGEPTYTDKRNIYVQFDVIDKVLRSQDNPYICMVATEDHPYECMVEPIQTNGLTHTNVGEHPYILATNKKALENIKKNNKETVSSLIDVDFKCKTGISNESAKRIIDASFETHKHNGYDEEEIINAIVKEMTGSFYKCDKEAVIQYTVSKLTA